MIPCTENSTFGPSRTVKARSASATEKSVLIVGSIEPIYIDAKNNGATWILLRNAAGSDVKALLTADGFRTSDGRVALEAKLSFTGTGKTSDSPSLELTVPAGATVPVQLSVSRYFVVGNATSTLHVNGRAYPVSAEFYDVPLRVTPLKADGTALELSLVRDEPDSLILKNDDPVAYSIAWRLTARGYDEPVAGDVLVAPNSQVELRVIPPASWFRHWFSGLFKDEALSGQMSLQVAVDTGSTQISGRSRALPSRSFPTPVKLSYGAWRNGLGNMLIFAVLALGACLSMVLNLWIPNYQRRADLLESLQDMAKEIRKLLQDVDSRLRVGLRVERLWLTEQTRTLRIPSLSATEQLKKYQTIAAVLRRRVDMANQLEETRRQLLVLQSANTGAPPSVLDAVASALATARNILSKSVPADDEFAAAKAAFGGAKKLLAQIHDEDQALAKRLTATRRSSLAMRTWYACAQPCSPSVTPSRAPRPIQLTDLPGIPCSGNRCSCVTAPECLATQRGNACFAGGITAAGG